MMTSFFKVFQTNPETEKSLLATDNFSEYLDSLIHSWLKTLTVLGFTLVPIFFVLDNFVIPSDHKDLLPWFAAYRFTATAIVVIQFILILKNKPSKYSFLHGYIFSFFVSLAIVLMTVDLGGFNSSYYAGLNLVIIAVNLLLPWKAFHSALNGTFVLVLYLSLNAVFGKEFEIYNLINNFYFMSSTILIAASINHVKYILIQKEFESRKDLKQARDALWGEMEIAKQIQTALIPADDAFENFEIAGVMIPATEVGGDYYDIIKTNKNPWVMIGDVSGHGVESGLVMMMAQTSVRTTISENSSIKPSKLLAQLNKVIKGNIVLLKAERYLTINAISLFPDYLLHSGSHQDILIYRNATNAVESFPTKGAWVGMLDDIESFLEDSKIPISKGDIVLLYTDGITELSLNDNLYGDDRLKESLLKYHNLSIKEIIHHTIKDALTLCPKQEDDITIVAIKKV